MKNNKFLSTQKTSTVIRNGWIELLRFFAITAILMRHFVDLNGLVGIWPLLSCGVATFVLISGFFSVKQTEWRTWKFFIKCLVWTFYGFIIYLICWLCNLPVQMPFRIFSGEFFRDAYTSWWFLFVYLAFTLFQPFVNKFIMKFRKWIVFGIIIVFFSCTTITNSIFISQTGNIYWSFITFNTLLFFLWVYSLGGWISFHYKERLYNKKWWKTLIFGVLLIIAFCLLWFKNQIFAYLQQQAFNTILLTELIDCLVACMAVLFFASLPIVKSIIFNKTLRMGGKISLPMYLLHSTVFIILDLFYPANPEMYNLGFYALKFFTYLIAVVVISIPMYYWIQLNEGWIYQIYGKYKAKHETKITTSC